MDQAISIDILRRRGRRQLAAGALACAALAAALWGLNRLVRPSLAGSDVTIAEVRRGNVDNTIDAAGVVVPVREEVVSSPGASRVARIHAKPGQQVKRGDLLLELDDHAIRLALESLQEQAAQQENRIVTLGQENDQKVKQIRSAIELLEIDLRAARATFERNQQLRASGLVSGENLLTSELNVKRREIELRQQHELVEDTRRATASSVAAARLQKAILAKQIAQQDELLAQTRVCAPFSGMLTALVENEGTSVAAGQQVARVTALDDFRVEASLSDFHAQMLAPGQAVRVEQNGQVLSGTVHTILPEIQNGSMKFLVDLDQPHHPLLRNKMRVDVNVITARRSGVLVIDSGPAFNGRGPQPAFRVEDGVARKTSLNLGASDGKVVEVIGEAGARARAGERFIVSDTSAFKDKDSIRIAN